MKRKNTTRNALLTSIISMLLCVSMLVGATFAWFTDEVKSGTNVIAAGNLDIEMTHTNGYVQDENVTTNTALFVDENGDAILWEPGVVAYETLTISNKGSLALNYNLAINITNENYVVDANGAATVYGLSSALKVAVLPGALADNITRENLVSTIAADAWKPLLTFNQLGDMEAGDADEVYTVVIYWQPGQEDNNWNVNNGKTTTDGDSLHIDLGVHLTAAQKMSESDSFGSDYDKLAVWTGDADTSWYNAAATEFVLKSGAELAGLAQIVNSGADTFTGKTVKLGADIDLNNVLWSPIGTKAEIAFSRTFNGTFIGTGYTISNLYVSGGNALGLFGRTGPGAHIEGVTINGAYVSGTDYVGAVAGYAYLSSNCIRNCTVIGAEIIANPYPLANGDCDGGAKAGVIVGYALNGHLIGNTVKDSSVTAYRDLGAIAGMLARDGSNVPELTAENNTVDGLTLTYIDLEGSYDGGKENQNMGNIVGRLGDKCTVGTNTETNVTRKTVIRYTIDGVTYSKDVDTGEVKLYLVPESYKGTTVNVAEGTTHIGSYAFAYNSNIEKIVLPSTVTTLNDRAFRDTSASTVVLNEGLTNISYQAFRNALNVTEVVIPSTVTTISKEAFQNSGVTELTVPAGVTTIEYGAMRDMKCLEKVVIESSATIPAYAFRSCTNLKTVILTNKDVTFDKGMIFSHYDTGISEGMTVYVANDEVKARLAAADSSAKYYSIVVATIPDADTPKEEVINNVDTALQTGGNVVLTQDMALKNSDTTANSGYGATGVSVQGGILDGNGHSLGINNWGTWDSAINITSGTIKNLTVNSGMRGIFINHNGAAGKVYLENVIIDGTVYTISCDQGTNSDLEATNCTFNGWTSYAATIGDVKFVDCSFGEGQGYAYCRPYAPTEFVGCDFAAGYTIDPRAAVTFENCTIAGVPLTAENVTELVTGTANVTVK